jgi:hypothetical protein
MRSLWLRGRDQRDSFAREALTANPISFRSSDVVGQKPWPVDDLCPVEPRGLQRQVQRGGDILGLHGCAQLPGDDVAREVVEDSRLVEPAPTDDFQIGVSRPGGLHPRPLAAPDVILPDHPAPIIRPQGHIPISNGGTPAETFAPIAQGHAAPLLMSG